MNRNDQQFIAQKIRTQYVGKPGTDLDALRTLDAKVKRPANIFSYVFGSIGAIVMGAGMSLVMTEIGTTLGLENTLPLGVAVGVVGLFMAVINYPIHQRILSSRRRKYAAEVEALSTKSLGEEA